MCHYFINNFSEFGQVLSQCLQRVVCLYVRVFVRSIFVCGDTFCEPDMTSVRRLVFCIPGVSVQTVVCVSAITSICAVPLLQ